MDLLEVLRRRRSIRVFTGDPIPEGVIDDLVEAAILAPSSRNMQPWHFHVATGETRRRVGQIMALTTQYLEEYVELLSPEEIARAAEFYANLGNAPVVIAVSTLVFEDETTMMNAYIAVGAAIENLLLRATDLGYGACSITVPSWVTDQVMEAFDVPADRRICALLLVGHAAEIPVPVDRRHDVVTFLT